MGEAASVISAYPGVRTALLDLQRRFAEQPGGAVLDGRDIGSVVCPGAEAKLFVTASPEERAARRHRELASRGDSTSFETVLADIRRRDERDSTRSAAPLVVPPGSVVLDTTLLDPDGALAAAVALVEGRLGGA
jgi:cytidylate kinase